MSHHDPWHLTNPEQTLTEIMRLARPAEGDVVVAHVAIASQQVTGVRVLSPAEYPGAVHGHAFADEEQMSLSQLLSDVANELAEPRGWTGSRWSEMTGTLITVVCRRGRVVDTAQEWRWAAAWRFANHLTCAFDGEVYAMTSHGWIATSGDRFGVQPRLAPLRVLA